ncbi:MAG: ABC transporter ATP-binding protein [Acidobacteria bacterium]|jgi:ABC-2 type transport system ATP-binding protein|nr:ABC transporter ATP-binding protein [Acidobacteriota bacterium]
MSENALEIRGLCKGYPGFALKDVSFAIPRGYVMGLIGPNGAGKTTIVKLIMNLVSRGAGEVEIFGLDSLEHEAEVKSRIGFVYDEACFPLDATPRDLGRAIGPFYPGWSNERYRGLLGEFDLPESGKLKKLSHGMQMKLALALALSHDADLILMDEPTAGLDLGFRRELLDHLSAILQDEGKSVLFSTHVTSDLERIADFVTFINDGELVFTLPKDELRDEWGIVKGNGSLPEQLAGLPIRGVRRGPYGVEALVADAAAARERCGKDVVVDRATLDDVMVFMTRGENDVDAR